MDKVDVNGKNAAPIFNYLKEQQPGFITSSVKCTSEGRKGGRKGGREGVGWIIGVASFRPFLAYHICAFDEHSTHLSPSSPLPTFSQGTSPSGWSRTASPLSVTVRALVFHVLRAIFMFGGLDDGCYIYEILSNAEAPAGSAAVSPLPPSLLLAFYFFLFLLPLLTLPLLLPTHPSTRFSYRPPGEARDLRQGHCRGSKLSKTTQAGV